jgi:hypothetical protein
MTKRRSVLLRILACVLATVALLYGLDYLSARLGVPARPRFSSYTIYRFYKINEKFNKYSFEPMSIAQEQCVNALFPHFGSRPCWYVQRHTMQAIDVN